MTYSVHSFYLDVLIVEERLLPLFSPLCSFRSYARIVEERLMPRFYATWHWAKLEVPQSESERKKLQSRVSKRYPVNQVSGLPCHTPA